MLCPYCRTANPDGAPYCSNCRQPLYYQHPQQTPGQPQMPYVPYTPPQPANDRGVLVLTIFLAWGAFKMIIWAIVSLVIVPPLRDNDGWNSVSMIYEITNWATDILTVLLTIALCIITSNKMARTILIIFGALMIVITALYKIFQ